jgi:starch-binding outer membrane protein, SusD/RagB family
MRNLTPKSLRDTALPLFTLGVTLALAGCDGLLDVTNPNKMVQEDLKDPAAAAPAVNGALATSTRALGAILSPYSTVSGEVRWIGSRDAWLELQRGWLANHRNEFTDAAFPYVAEARWMGDEAIKLLEGYVSQNQLRDRNQLARAYLYSAVMYTAIGDMFDEFVVSDRRESGQVIGKPNMPTFYDQALERLNKGLAITQATGNAALHTELLAVRARTHHAKAVRQRATSPNPSAPLVSVAAANADAQAVIDRVGAAADWRMQFLQTPSTPVGDLSLALQINQRSELDFAPAYAVRDAGATQGRRITLMDPIDEVPSPYLRAMITGFRAELQFAPITVTSAREMHLILAEAALAGNNLGDFRTHINRLRALDQLTAYTDQVPALALLRHSRRENLYLQGRRLSDLYRFGEQAPDWQAASNAVASPGTFLPVTCIERAANSLAYPQGCS